MEHSVEGQAQVERSEKQQRKDKLYRIRHSAAHIMAQAVVEIFPDAKMAIGPPIADGFYYDFDLPRALTPEDLEDIEKRMKRIVKGNHKFLHSTMSREEAHAFFAERDQDYKLELIDGIPDEEMSIYQQDTFIDLCRGPHVARTKQCKHFKLLKIAGAYWRGDSDRPMLQRIYGTAWSKKDELVAYLEMLEEAKRRDHRRVGKELDLFSFHNYSPGAVFWHPRGWIVYENLVNLWKEMQRKNGYVEIRNPLIYDSALYETSGHLEHYRDNMFTLETEGRLMCVKPMNCPDTMLFYKTRKHSYRELPMRVAETQILHRNELSGALSGMTRVRQFCQDDAHIFAMPEQIEDELRNLLALLDETYALFNLDYRLYFSTRPDDYMGALELWNEAETSLKAVLDGTGRPYHIKEGDGAFYGPKIDICIQDCLGRLWQCATIQLDFQIPERFDLEYVGADNKPHRPVVIHRAIFGSFERFIAILIEHLAGAFPTWLAPVQAIFLPITDAQNDYCHQVAQAWERAGVRVHVDDRSEKIGYKIREAELAKVPYMLVVGNREVEAGALNLRTYQEGKRGTLQPDEILSEIQQKIAERTLDVNVQALDFAQFIDVDDLDASAQAY